MANFIYAHIAKEGETPTHTIGGVGYVGVELPKLPEWDKTVYPYAVISEKYKFQLDVGKITWYELIIYDKEIVAISDTVCGAFDTLYTKCKCTDGEWGDFTEPIYSESVSAGDVIWAYKPIYRSDSDGNATTTLWMDAVDPIPVGSAPEVEPKSFMAGWRMGQFIRGMRG